MIFHVGSTLSPRSLYTFSLVRHFVRASGNDPDLEFANLQLYSYDLRLSCVHEAFVLFVILPITFSGKIFYRTIVKGSSTERSPLAS